MPGRRRTLTVRSCVRGRPFFGALQPVANCGADGWAITPSGSRGIVNDALAVYFADATLASAFVARCCVGGKVETVDGVFRVRDDEPTPRVGAGLHRTP